MARLRMVWFTYQIHVTHVAYSRLHSSRMPSRFPELLSGFSLLITPSEDECKKILVSVFTIKRIDSCYENDFRHLITPPPFNAEFLGKASKGVVNDKLRESVIK